MSREPDERIGDFVLGELSAEERRQLEQRIAADPALRERVAGLEALAGMLESLPGEAWATLGSAGRPAPEEVRPRRRRYAARLRLGSAVAALALALGAGIGIGVLIERPASPTGPTVVLHALAGRPSAAEALARMTPGGRMLLSAEHLPATPPGEFYELWLMNNRRSLVAVASFRVGSGGRAQLDVPLPAAPAHYRYLDISLQQAAAGPAHSGDSVLRAPIPA